MNKKRLGRSVQRSVWVMFGCALLSRGMEAASDPAIVLERLHRVITQTSLDAPGTKPWHVKLSVDIKAQGGDAAEKGTIEEWWASPTHYKRAYNFPSYTGTTVVTPVERYVTDAAGSPPYLADYLLNQVVHPMPRVDEVDQAHLDLRRETFGKSDFDCVMLVQPIKNVAYPPFGLFPTYCLDRDKDVLRISAEYSGQTVLMNRKGIFRADEVAIDFTVNRFGKEIASAHVEGLQGQDVPYPESQDVTGLKPVIMPTANVEGKVIAGYILKQVTPEYPESAKLRHASGTVLLHAIIGKEGYVHFLKPETFPDPDLVIAAIAAVRQWTYKPYLLNGEPTEVDTTVTVNFNLGR